MGGGWTSGTFELQEKVIAEEVRMYQGSIELIKVCCRKRFCSSNGSPRPNLYQSRSQKTTVGRTVRTESSNGAPTVAHLLRSDGREGL